MINWTERFLPIIPLNQTYSTISLNDDGKEDGKATYYHKNGTIMQTMTYLDGELDGELIEYYSSGKILKKCSYKDGEEDGKYVSYFENGKVKCRRKLRGRQSNWSLEIFS